MEGRLARLEARLEELTASLKALEARVDGLGAGAPRPPAVPPAVPAVAMPAASEGPWVGSLQHLGKSLLVLGGAFLIRALTDGGTLPREAGIALGLAYAVAWIIVADRAGSRGRGLSATFFGSTAIFIACPLALEGATRFAAFPASAAAGLLAGFAGFTLLVAWRRNLPALAWVATLAVLATLLVLLLTAYAVVPVSAALLVLGVATVGLAYSRRHWHGVRWPVAALADLVVVLMTWLASQKGGVPEPYRGLSASAAFWLALTLPVVYVGSAALRTLLRRRDVTAFEAVQSVASLLVGLGGAAAVARATGSGQSSLGTAGLALAAACYGVAFAFVERRSKSAGNFHFYAGLALVLTLLASGLLSTGGPLSGLWSVMGVAATMIGARLDRMTLRSHGALYLAAAAIASGLAAAPRQAFLGAPVLSLSPLSAWAAVALCASAASFLVLAAGPGATAQVWYRRLPALAALLFALAGIGALAVRLSIGLTTDGRDPGALAAARTAVLSLSALALAATFRRTRLPEVAWTAWALLVAGGAKILLQDVPAGRPATLVAALAVYGLALTFAPRWLRRR
jgi:hypothetical protein